MIPIKLQREIEKMVHKRSPQFYMKLITTLMAAKQKDMKKKKDDNIN